MVPPVIPSNPNEHQSIAPNKGEKGVSASQHQSPGDSSKEPKKATAMDHLSKGPQIPDQMPPKASREETEARMKELNK